MAAGTGPSEHLLTDFVKAGPFLDPEYLLATAQQFVNTLKTKGVDVFLPCGTTDGGPAVQDCWIAYHLGVLNRTLERVCLELREDGPGVMTLDTLFPRGNEFRRVSDSLLFDAAFLFFWLLQHHRCVRTVLLGTGSLLCERMPTLVSNSFSGNLSVLRLSPSPVHTNLPGVILSGLQRMTNLRELHLGESVELSGCSASHLMAALDAGRLRSLVLEKYPKGKKDARRLLRALSNCSSLTSLHILSGAVGIPGAAALLSRGLRSLCLGGANDLRASEVLTSLAGNDSLEELCLPDGIRQMSGLSPQPVELLAANRRLRSLRMANFTLLDRGATAFAQVLRSNSTLEEVDLAGCGIRNAGAIALALALEANDSLKALYLENNDVNTLAVPAFLRALLRNERIECVRLGHVGMYECWKPDVVIDDPDKVFGRLQVEWNSWGLEETERYVSSIAGAADQHQDKALRLHWTQEVSIECVERLLLTSSAHFIVELVIAGYHPEQRRLAGGIAALLRCTRTLKKLEVKPCTWDEQAQLALFSAFEDNSTVCTAELVVAAHLHGVTAALGNMLRKNRTLQSLTIWIIGLKEPYLGLLARSVKDNDALLNLSFKHCLSGEVVRWMPRLLRRNRCLVNRAAKYALRASSDAESKEAFGKLVGRDSLVDTLMSATGKTWAECKQLVEDIAREMSDHVDEA